MSLQDASLLRFLVDMRGADVDGRQVNICPLMLQCHDILNAGNTWFRMSPCQSTVQANNSHICGSEVKPLVVNDMWSLVATLHLAGGSGDAGRLVSICAEPSFLFKNFGIILQYN